jgi:hypothetical protein
MRPWSKWKISQAQKYRNNRYFLPVSIFFVKTLVSIVFGIGIGPSLYKYLFFTISANLHYVDLIWPSGCESNPRPLGYHALEQTWPRSSVGRAAIGLVGLSKREHQKTLFYLSDNYCDITIANPALSTFLVGGSRRKPTAFGRALTDSFINRVFTYESIARIEPTR